MRRLHRGDLSAPVLAIIVTIGVIAAGLVLMAWFWWFAPQAGKAGVLQILGTPSIVWNGTAKLWVTYISVRNTGNDPITVTGVVVKGVRFDSYYTDGWIVLPEGTYTNTLDPGKSGIIIAKNATTLTIETTEYTVPGVINTNYGVVTVSLSVVR
jgi:hypothetical protein